MEACELSWACSGIDSTATGTAVQTGRKPKPAQISAGSLWWPDLSGQSIDRMNAVTTNETGPYFLRQNLLL
jgi:hypothetical protein